MLTYKLLTILCVLLFIIYRKLKRIYTHWEKMGVKGEKPIWLFGNVLYMLLGKETLESLMKRIYDTYPNEKALGMYLGVVPALILKDPALIKNVLMKDYTTFSDRGMKITEDKYFDSLFFEKGELWKVYRQKLSPWFSTGKMKNLLPDLLNNTDQYLNYIENLSRGPEELRKLEHKLSFKVTKSSFFGLKDDSLSEEFYWENIGDILNFPVRYSMATLLYGLNRKLPTALGIKMLPGILMDTLIEKSNDEKKKNLRTDENAFDYIVNLRNHGIVKKHKKDGIINIKISDSVVSGHSVIFMAAGMEVYSTSSFLLYELAKHQDIQERCYREIKQVMEKYNEELTFEAINELQYVNMAFEESLRLYPNGGSLFRLAANDYYFKDIDLTIKKGMLIIVPVQALHYDPNNFPNPEVFDPERFSPENRSAIKDFSYLPFGEGPRKCIGFRLAKLQSVVLVAKFLYKFKVTPCEKTVSKPRIKPLLLSLYTDEGLWVNINKRKQS